MQYMAFSRNTIVFQHPYKVTLFSVTRNYVCPMKIARKMILSYEFLILSLSDT
jgi:hypothetical protein